MKMPGGVSFSTKTRPVQRSPVSKTPRKTQEWIIEEYYSEYSSGRV